MSRKTSRQDAKALESLGSFKVSASVLEAATSCLGLVSDFKRLGLVSDKILNVLISETWVSGLSSEGLVHIPDKHTS